MKITELYTLSHVGFNPVFSWNFLNYKPSHIQQETQAESYRKYSHAAQQKTISVQLFPATVERDLIIVVAQLVAIITMPATSSTPSCTTNSSQIAFTHRKGQRSFVHRRMISAAPCATLAFGRFYLQTTPESAFMVERICKQQTGFNFRWTKFSVSSSMTLRLHSALHISGAGSETPNQGCPLSWCKCVEYRHEELSDTCHVSKKELPSCFLIVESGHEGCD